MEQEKQDLLEEFTDSIRIALLSNAIKLLVLKLEEHFDFDREIVANYINESTQMFLKDAKKQFKADYMFVNCTNTEVVDRINEFGDIICKYLYIEQADYSSKKLKNQILKSSEVSDQITYCKKSLESLPPFPKFTLRTKS